ncbi:unnamed protein product [Acanthosepion pharaonis]|uniref:Uncharacterized protein n=1 Tax=Acanthosepion pharaonis TaxID=158019 RepID=A0A812D4R1_ACAPH|nr:unnamed protein product [Sepia pharaonis]
MNLHLPLSLAALSKFRPSAISPRPHSVIHCQECHALLSLVSLFLPLFDPGTFSLVVPLSLSLSLSLSLYLSIYLSISYSIVKNPFTLSLSVSLLDFFFVRISTACPSACYCIIQENTWFKSPLGQFFKIAFTKTCYRNEGLSLSWPGDLILLPLHASSGTLHNVIRFSQSTSAEPLFAKCVPIFLLAVFKRIVTPPATFHRCRYHIQVPPWH